VVVGAGNISAAWFPVLLREEVQVAAVVDLDPDAARARIREFGLGAEASDDLDAALKQAEPDLVVDLTVPEAHCEVTCTALEAGCPVIGEKPMAAKMDEARRMVETAERTGRLYMVSQSRRWNPHHEVLRRMATEGAVGRISTVNCDFYMAPHFGGFREEMPSPLLLDMAIHHFDLARYLTGADPVSVYAHEFSPAGSWYAGDASASCLFEMTDGIVFSYRGCWCAEGCATSWNGHWRLVGERGTLLYESDRPPHGQAVAGEGGFFRPLKDLDVPPARLEHTGMHGALREMLRYLRTGEVPQTECHDNIKSLAMVFAAMQSARHGERLPVET
jgi:predicted dehydrogenase